MSEVMKAHSLLPCLRRCMGSADQDVRQWALGLLTASSSYHAGMRQLQRVCACLWLRSLADFIVSLASFSISMRVAQCERCMQAVCARPVV